MLLLLNCGSASAARLSLALRLSQSYALHVLAAQTPVLPHAVVSFASAFHAQTIPCLIVIFTVNLSYSFYNFFAELRRVAVLALPIASCRMPRVNVYEVLVAYVL